MDWLGCSLLAGAVAMLLLSIANFSGVTAIMFVVLLVSFVWRIQRAATPLLSRMYSKCPLLAWISDFFCHDRHRIFPCFLTPTLLTQVHVLRPGLSGIVMAPAAIAAALLSQSGGKMADNRGISFLFRIAASLFLICFLYYRHLRGLRRFGLRYS